MSWGYPYWGGYYGYPYGYGYYGYPYGYGYYPYGYYGSTGGYDDPPPANDSTPDGAFIPNARVAPPQYSVPDGYPRANSVPAPYPRSNVAGYTASTNMQVAGYTSAAVDHQVVSARPGVRNVVSALQNMPPEARQRQLESGRYNNLSASEMKFVRTAAGVPPQGR